MDSISSIVDELYKMDPDRLEIGSDIVLDFKCSSNIFKYINSDIIKSSSSWSAALLAIDKDLVNMKSENPVYDFSLVKEFYNFISSISNSMIELIASMTTNSQFKNNKNAVLGFVYHLFFNRIRLSMRSDKVASLSSSFRHIFIGERYNSKLSGEHFWYRLYQLQSNGVMTVDNAAISALYLTYSSSEGQVKKRLNGCLIGVSPSFLLLMWSVILMELNATSWNKSGGHGGNLIIDGVTYSYTLYYDVAGECLMTGFITHAKAKLSMDSK